MPEHYSDKVSPTVIAAIEAARKGDGAQIKVEIRRLRTVIQNDSEMAEISADLNELAIYGLVAHDEWLLSEIAALPDTGMLIDRVIQAADMGWKWAYDLLREPYHQLNVQGITMSLAYKMQDPSAYKATGPNAFIKVNVNDFLADVHELDMESQTKFGDPLEFLQDADVPDWVIGHAREVIAKW